MAGKFSANQYLSTNKLQNLYNSFDPFLFDVMYGNASLFSIVLLFFAVYLRGPYAF